MTELPHHQPTEGTARDGQLPWLPPAIVWEQEFVALAQASDLCGTCATCLQNQYQCGGCPGC